MLAAAAEGPFSRQGWLFEIKYDGVRVLAAKRPDGGVRLYSRNGRDTTSTYPEVSEALRRLPVDEFILDGEIVALDARGRSSFERLQRRLTLSDPDAIARARAEVPVVLYAFDLLFAAGHDLRGLPLSARKRILALFVSRRGTVRFADHVEREGEALFEAAREHGLEGIVAKQTDSGYVAGRRSRRWLKLKVARSATLVIVGYRRGRGSPASLRSLMLAWQADGRLVYAGHVGAGLNARTREVLRLQLDAIRRDEPAFSGGSEPRSRGAVYTEPAQVCEVRFTDVTGAGRLRHPVFLRLRDDKKASECDAPPSRDRLIGSARQTPEGEP